MPNRHISKEEKVSVLALTEISENFECFTSKKTSVLWHSIQVICKKAKEQGFNSANLSYEDHIFKDEP